MKYKWIIPLLIHNEQGMSQWLDSNIQKSKGKGPDKMYSVAQGDQDGKGNEEEEKEKRMNRTKARTAWFSS